MRLNKYQKTTVVNRLITETFKERRETQALAASEISEDLARLDLGPNRDALLALPRKHLVADGTASINRNVVIGSSTYAFDIEKQHAKGTGGDYGDALRVRENSALAKKMEAYVEEESLVYKQETTLRQQLAQALVPYTTVKKLREDWPEAAKHVLGATTDNLPAIPLGQVKKLMEVCKTA